MAPLIYKGKRRTIKSLDEKLGFGIHAENTVEEVLKFNRTYLQWMHEKTQNKLGKRLINQIEKLDEKYIGMFKKL